MPHGIMIDKIALVPNRLRGMPVWQLTVRNATDHDACALLEATGRDARGSIVMRQGVAVTGLGPKSSAEVVFDPCGDRWIDWTVEKMTIYWAGADGMLLAKTEGAPVETRLGNRAGRIRKIVAAARSFTYAWLERLRPSPTEPSTRIDRDRVAPPTLRVVARR